MRAATYSSSLASKPSTTKRIFRVDHGIEKGDMDTEKGTIVTPGDVVGPEKKHGDLEEYLVKESFVPAQHNEQHQTRKMVVMRRTIKKARRKNEASQPSILCAWLVEYQLGT